MVRARAFAWLGLLAVSASALAGPLTVTLLHSNDLHARVEPAKAGQNLYGGYARQIGLVRKLAATEKNPLLVNAGDTFQGTLYFNAYNGLADAALMNLAGYRAMAVGNHEFDLGPAALGAFAKSVSFPILAANLDVSAEPLLAGLVKPSTVVKVGKESVGFIGAATPDLPFLATCGPNVKMRDLAASLNEAVAGLKAQRIDKIVLLSHLGYPLDQEIARSVPGLDVIVGAHTHTLLGKFDNPDFPPSEGEYPTVVRNPEGDTLIVTSWEWGKMLGRLRVEFDGKGRVRKWSGNPIPLDASVEPDPVAASMVAAFQLPIESLRRTVVANASVALDASREKIRKEETNLGDVVADAMLAKARASGAEIAFANGGGIRASIDAGPVTYEEAIAVQPFNNTLAVVKVSGVDLLKALEHGVSGWEAGEGRFPQVSKGMAYTFDPSKPVGSRIVEATFDGQPIDPARTYSVVVTSYVSNGGDGYAMFAAAPKLETGLLDVDALVEYLKSGVELPTDPAGRIRRL